MLEENLAILAAIVIGIFILLNVIESFDMPVFKKLPCDHDLEVDVFIEEYNQWYIQQVMIGPDARDEFTDALASWEYEIDMTGAASMHVPLSFEDECQEIDMVIHEITEGIRILKAFLGMNEQDEADEPTWTPETVDEMDRDYEKNPERSRTAVSYC